VTKQLAWWPIFGVAASTLLPWYALPDGTDFFSALIQTFSSAETGNAWIQAMRNGRVWLFSPIVALIISSGLLLIAAANDSNLKQPANASKNRSIAWALIIHNVIGLACLVGGSFAIGIKGWNASWLEQLAHLAHWPEPANQFGIGWGGCITCLMLLVTFSIGLAKLGLFRADVMVASFVTICAGALLLFIVLPVGKTFIRAIIDENQAYSLMALVTRLGTERVWGIGCITGHTACGVAWNTVFLGLFTAAGTTALGTTLALLAQRSFKRGEKLPGLLAITPIITPPFVVGLGLILLFGRSGLVNQFLEFSLGITPTRWFYGLPGLVLAQLFAFTPVAFLIMRGVVQGISPTLEEAASTLKASRWKIFVSVTLPLLRPGLTNAFLVGFIESMADFGNPILLGGAYSVLSTEIFFAIVGAQMDQGRAASLALLLSAFALCVFGLQRWILGKASYTTVAGKGDAGISSPLPQTLEKILQTIGIAWISFTVVVYLFAFVGGFVENWGRDYTPTLKHLRSAFDIQWSQFGIVWAGTAWNSLWTTVKLAAIAAPITAALGLVMSYLIARTQFKGRDTFEFLSLLAFAVPGTVLGVSYVLAFNVPPIEITGTAMVIILCFVFRNLPVGVRAGSAAFKQLDKNLDEASTMLHASTPYTLRRVILPLLKPAVLASLIYSFVRAMTTVSAVIFLVTAEYELATTYIIGRVGNGDYGIALAYCTVLIVLMLAAIGVIQWLVGDRKLGRRKSGASSVANNA
jgi:iron(III) transport system permease protein